MKYLKLHKVLWFILVLLYTLLELAYFIFLETLYFVWCLKFFKYKDFFSNDCISNGNKYVDKNVIDTFMRHYTMFN